MALVEDKCLLDDDLHEAPAPGFDPVTSAFRRKRGVGSFRRCQVMEGKCGNFEPLDGPVVVKKARQGESGGSCSSTSQPQEELQFDNYLTAVFDKEIDRKRDEFGQKSDPVLAPVSPGISPALKPVEESTPTSAPARSPVVREPFRSIAPTTLVNDGFKLPLAAEEKPAPKKGLLNTGCIASVAASKRRAKRKVDERKLLVSAPKDAHKLDLWWQEEVRAPWHLEGSTPMSRGKCLKELREANPLHEHLGEKTKEGFYAIMVERELVRIRRFVLKWPRMWWSAHWVFQRVRLTNVKRSEDTVSKAVQAAAAQANPIWKQAAAAQELAELGTPSDGLMDGERGPKWSDLQRHIAGRLIFSVALWRAFGTATAIDAIGLAKFDFWTKDERKTIAQRLARAALTRAHDMEGKLDISEADFCFTRAYAPARTMADAELSCIKAKDEHALIQTYAGMLGDSFGNLFKAKVQLAEQAKRGAKALTEALMRIPGFGGTGFTAKEVVEDLKSTVVFSSAALNQNDDWAVSGPGARRGCNRLSGRPLSWNVNVPRDKEPKLAEGFLKEMRELWNLRTSLWPSGFSKGCKRRDVEELCRQKLGQCLNCNDIQFQLCEADKFFRALESCSTDVDTTVRKMRDKGLRIFRPRPE
mmetsp:Transcript_4435/g.9673  ORF Transcript_4435/g.9673 Transcript_4435/m.9673 type:complete len:642 (+) Transcript_4435:51-1976(+)